MWDLCRKSYLCVEAFKTLLFPDLPFLKQRQTEPTCSPNQNHDDFHIHAKALPNKAGATKYCQRGPIRTVHLSRCSSRLALPPWCEIIMPRRPTGDFLVQLFAPWFPVASRLCTVTTNCLYLQLCLVYFCHSLQLRQDAYATQHTVHDHQCCCLLERNQFAPSLLALLSPFSFLPLQHVLLNFPWYVCTAGLPSWLLTSKNCPSAHKPKHTLACVEAYSLWSTVLGDKMFWSGSNCFVTVGEFCITFNRIQRVCGCMNETRRTVYMLQKLIYRLG